MKAHTESEVNWVNYPLAELESSLPEKMFFRARREVVAQESREAKRIAPVKAKPMRLLPRTRR